MSVLSNWFYRISAALIDPISLKIAEYLLKVSMKSIYSIKNQDKPVVQARKKADTDWQEGHDLTNLTWE